MQGSDVSVCQGRELASKKPFRGGEGSGWGGKPDGTVSLSQRPSLTENGQHCGIPAPPSHP